MDEHLDFLLGLEVANPPRHLEPLRYAQGFLAPSGPLERAPEPAMAAE